jgi:hypothetical protein
VYQQSVLTPWWIIELISKTLRLARECPRLEKKPTIRAAIKAFDHTRSTTEMRLRRIPTLGDVMSGLRLALRSRMSLRPDYIDFEDPRANVETIDRITEDVFALAMEELSKEIDNKTDIESKGKRLKSEIQNLVKDKHRERSFSLDSYQALSGLAKRIRDMAPDRLNPTLLSDEERALYRSPGTLKAEIRREYDLSAVEILVNAAVSQGIVKESSVKPAFFVPRRFES